MIHSTHSAKTARSRDEAQLKLLTVLQDHQRVGPELTRKSTEAVIRTGVCKNKCVARKHV